MNNKIAVTIRTFDSDELLMRLLDKSDSIIYKNQTGKRLSEKELSEVLKESDGVIAGTEPFTEDVINNTRKLKVISRVGVGIDNIDQNVAQKNGIIIKNTPESPALAVAEHTFALILSILKRITMYNSNMRKGIYEVEPGNMLSGKEVGIVGLGRIGYKVAELLDAFGCQVLYYDPYVDDKKINRWIKIGKLEELVGSVDILTLHAATKKGDEALINEEMIKKCRDGIILINAARGTLIDENVLVNAIETGKVSGAGLDVFPEEPYKGRLLEYPQVITTPHVASNTVESRKQMEKEAIENLIEGLRKAK